MSLIRRITMLVVTAALLAPAAALAAGPNWMPGFPMRMGPNVMLMWTPVPGATSYNLYRSNVQGELGAKIMTSPMNNHMDANVPMDKDAIYIVKAVTSDGKEGEAGKVGVLEGVKPLDPPKFSGQLMQGDGLSVRWDLVGGASFYNLFKGLSAEGPFDLVGSVQEAKYMDSAVEEGKTYYYQVSAVDKNSTESTRSEVLSAEIPKAAVVVKVKKYDFTPVVMPVLGTWYGGTDLELRGPSDILYSKQHNVLYVCDTVGLVMMDPASGDITANVTEPAGNAGQWGKPVGIAVDSSGDLWATFYPSGAIRRFDAAGTLVSEFFTEAPVTDYEADGRMDKYEQDKRLLPAPIGIAIDSQDRVWLGDNSFGQVLVYDMEGTLLKRIGKPRVRSDEQEKFFGMGILTTVRYHSQTDRIYVLDPTNQTLWAFGMDLERIKGEDGEPSKGFVRAGSSTGYMGLPKGFAVTPEGNLAVIDGLSLQLQVFDQEMDYLYTVVSKEGGEKKFPEEFSGPVNVSVSANRIFVADKLGKQVVAFEYKP